MQGITQIRDIRVENLAAFLGLRSDGVELTLIYTDPSVAVCIPPRTLDGALKFYREHDDEYPGRSMALDIALQAAGDDKEKLKMIFKCTAPNSGDRAKVIRVLAEKCFRKQRTQG